MTNAVPFITLLRRATHSGFDSVIMNNRMFIQCYDLNIDSDIALNYMLFVPDTDDYASPFYDTQMILHPRKILDAYAVGHKYIEEKRKW